MYLLLLILRLSYDGLLLLMFDQCCRYGLGTIRMLVGEFRKFGS